MDVTYDEAVVSPEDIGRAVEDAGYGVVPMAPETKKVELLIEGMTCAACSAAAERVTRRLPGVAGASVNLTTGRGAFEYDPKLIKLSEIKAAIEDAGYTPRDIEGEKNPRPGGGAAGRGAVGDAAAPPCGGGVRGRPSCTSLWRT